MPLPDDVIASARLLADITGRLPRRPAIPQTPKGNPMTRSQILAYLLARFSEPSSYAGIGGVLAAVGLSFSDTAIGQLVLAMAGLCGFAAVMLKEKGIIQSLALVVALGAGSILAACTATGPVDIASCGAALLAASAGPQPGQPKDDAALQRAASTTPACTAASADVVQSAIEAAKWAQTSGGKPPQSW